MEETSGLTIADLSGNSHELSVSGTANWAADIPITSNADTRSLYLDGSTFAQLTNQSEDIAFDFPHGFTLEAWIKPDGISNAAIVSKFFPRNNGYMSWFYNSNAINYFDGPKVWGTSYLSNSWHYVATTWDGQILSLYIDGVKEGSDVTQVSPPTSLENTLLIGSYNPGAGFNFKGNIDEVKIWDGARTAEQIKSDAGIINGSAVVLNELMADPAAGNEWVELYNKSSSPADISSWSISDAVNHTINITSDLVTGHGYKVYFFNTHVLNNDTDTVNLLDNFGSTLDTVTYTPPMTAADKSTGRNADGTGLWKQCNTSTQNASNNANC